MKKEGWLNREIAKKYFLCFLFYAFCGWIYEMTLELITYPIHEISNRGVLFGPWIPVYGVGAICFVLFFYRFLAHTNLARKLILLPLMFVLCMLVSTLLELVTSYLLEFLTGSFPWTYLHHPWNFEGRIALHASARFGFGGILALYIFQPLLEARFDRMKVARFHRVFVIAFTLFVLDIIISLLFAIF